MGQNRLSRETAIETDGQRFCRHSVQLQMRHSGILATSDGQLGSPLWHASALRQQLGHDPARCVHTGVCQDDRIALPRAFRHGA